MSRIIVDAPKNSRAGVLLIPGFFGDKDESRGLYRDFANVLMHEGIGVMRYDPIGIGEGLERDSPTYEMWCGEAINHLYALSYLFDDRIGILGFSLGAAIAVDAIKENFISERVRALALWAPALNPRDHMLARYKDNGDYQDAIDGKLEKNEVKVSQKTLDSLDFDKLGFFDGVTHPTIIFHGTDDERVPPLPREVAEGQFPDLRNYELIKGAGHSFRKGDDVRPRLRVYNTTASFFREQLL